MPAVISGLRAGCTRLPALQANKIAWEISHRFSGGVREQLSVLTRLAFALLSAKDGRTAPVMLDEALVYSDDDRIERMFEALHRQAQERQIIVLSRRQRALQKLGGNALRLSGWSCSE